MKSKTIEMKKPLERRKYKRFKVKEGTFAVLRAPVTKVGQIIDISRGGLAFSHMANGEASNGLFQLDIVIIDKGFRLNKVPIKTVSDVEIVKKIPFSSTTMRRLSVQFGELKSSHISQLTYFFQHYAIG